MCPPPSRKCTEGSTTAPSSPPTAGGGYQATGTNGASAGRDVPARTLQQVPRALPEPGFSDARSAGANGGPYFQSWK
jgi:hypothetical protein